MPDPVPDDVPLWDTWDPGVGAWDPGVDELALPNDPALRGELPAASQGGEPDQPASRPEGAPPRFAPPIAHPGGPAASPRSAQFAQASAPARPSQFAAETRADASWETYDPSTREPARLPAPQPVVFRSAPARKSKRGPGVAVVAALVVAAGIFGNFPHDNPPSEDEVAASPWRTAPMLLEGSVLGVAAVSDEGEGSLRSGSGTWVKIDSDSSDSAGLVVTAYHLIAGSTSVQIVDPDEEPIVAQVAGFDIARDIAVLRVPHLTEHSDAYPASLSTERPSVDEPVVILHNFMDKQPAIAADTSMFTLGDQATIRTYSTDNGYLSKPSGLFFVMAPEGADAADAGDPIANLSDEVVGMTVWRDYDNLYAVPSADISSVVETVVAGKDAGTVRVGPSGGLGLRFRTDGRLPTVTSVVTDGPAAKAGIAKDDLLVEIDGKSLATGDLREVGTEGIVRMLEPGAKVKVTWRPAGGGEDKTATLTVAENTTN